MDFKKSILILIMAIFLTSIAGVCAGDANDTPIASDDANQIVVSSNDMMTEDSLKTSEEDTTFAQTDDESVSAAVDSEILGEGNGTYEDLRDEIGNGGNKSLARSYYNYTGGDTIEITTPGVINGNGAVIDMAGSAIQAFKISASGVTIKNMTIKNVNYAGIGGAVYFIDEGIVKDCSFVNDSAYAGGALSFGQSGSVENCNFTDNRAISSGMIGIPVMGGAVYFDLSGIVENCNFINNSAGYGGALSFRGNATVTNCRFNYNKASTDGGAVYFMNSGEVEKCDFAGNNASGLGGALFFLDINGTVTDCSFTDNSANYGGAVYFTALGIIESSSFSANNASNGGAVYYYADGEVKNSNFTANSAHTAGAVFFASNATVENSNFDANLANYSGAVCFAANATILNCNFTANTAKIYAGAVNFKDKANLENCRFVKNKAANHGGAVAFEKEGSVADCSFEANNVSGNGGAVYFAHATGSVENCNFTGNSASMGGAVYFSSPDSVAICCDFAGNNALGDGGAVYFDSAYGWVEKCNFTSNSALMGGAVYFKDSARVLNCSFASNNVSGDGGAVYSYYTDDVAWFANCNFTDNSASGVGGAARTYYGIFECCNFTGNTAVSDGGAVLVASGDVVDCSFACNTGRCGGALWVLNAQVMNCNFEKNNAFENGGAVFFDSGDLEDCNFTANTASNQGGAICFDAYSNPTNCNFANNTALMGGAAYFSGGAAVHYCNFTGNVASNGSALYFGDTPENNLVHNSTFLENRADAQAIDIIKNDDNITIVFTGNDNLLNAIYSNADVRFTNVTYLGADGIVTNTDSFYPTRSNREAGQNITVAIIVDDRIILDDVKITDAEGTVVIHQSITGNYAIIACHDEDSYYTRAERMLTNAQYYINVTSVEANNRTVNLTAKSNIYGEVMPEVPEFIISNGDSIAAVYGGNGTWWAVYTFDDYLNYNVSASYGVLENLTVGNATVVITRADSTLIVDNVVMEYGDSLNLSVTAEGATGITARIDGIDVGVSGFSIMISGLNVGPHTLEVMTVPDEDHNSVRKTANITVSKLKTQLVADPITVIYNRCGDLTITLKDMRGNPLANQILLVDFNGEKIYDFTDSNGTIKVPLKGLAANTYAGEIVFMGNDIYNGSDANATVTVKKDSTSLSGNAVTAVYNVNKNLVITLKDSRGNPIKGASVTVDLNGARSYSTDAKGQIKVAVGSLVPKVYTAKIAFKGSGNYIASSKTVKVTVKKATPKLAAKNKKFKKSKKVKKYTVTLKSNVGKAMKKVRLTIKVGKKTYAAKTNAKGQATFNLKKLTKKGKYTAVLTFKGDKYYNKITKKVKITVK